MQRVMVPVALLTAVSALLLAQNASVPLHPADHETPRDEVRLPNGKLQIDEMLKFDHEESVKDAKRLVDLSQELKKDLDQESSAHILSLADVHRTEDIERLAKRIRARLRRY